MKTRVLFRISLLASLGFLLKLLEQKNDQIWDDVVGILIGVSIAAMLLMLGFRMFNSKEDD